MNQPNTTPNATADRLELEAAVRVIISHNPQTVAEALRNAGDGIDTDLRIVALLAETAAYFSRIVTERQHGVADSHLRAMEYGEALHARLLARAVSEYSAHIEQAHEASHEAETSADALGLEESQFPEGDEPTTAEAYSAACRFYGV
jgi:hypothetical protein